MSEIITINMVTFRRYEQFEKNLLRVLNNTDGRFIVDVWNDGIDKRKEKIVKKTNSPKVKYHCNLRRQNKYGHDMRAKSLRNCRTKYWCTMNDDGIMSKEFVATVFAHEAEIIRYMIGMVNWLPDSTENADAKEYIKAFDYGYTAAGNFTRLPILGEYEDVRGRIDACSFVVNTELAKKTGWKSTAYEADWIFYESIKAKAKSISRVQEVLQLHV